MVVQCCQWGYNWRAHAMALTSCTKLGPYEIQSQLGAGGMGEVYRALDTHFERTVAIKVLASHLSSSPELKQRMDPAFNICVVSVNEAGGALHFGAPQTLVSNWSSPQAFYDVAPDGKRILLDRISQQVSQSVSVVTNFTAGLKR